MLHTITIHLQYYTDFTVQIQPFKLQMKPSESIIKTIIIVFIEILNSKLWIRRAKPATTDHTPTLNTTRYFIPYFRNRITTPRFIRKKKNTPANIRRATRQFSEQFPWHFRDNRLPLRAENCNFALRIWRQFSAYFGQEFITHVRVHLCNCAFAAQSCDVFAYWCIIYCRRIVRNACRCAYEKRDRFAFECVEYCYGGFWVVFDFGFWKCVGLNADFSCVYARAF